MKYFSSIFLSAFAFLLLTTSCSSPKTTIQNQTVAVEYAREYNPQELKELLKEYRTLVRSLDKNEKPAPGIYAEYALLLFKSGDLKNAAKMIILELKYYPEAKPYLENLIQGKI